MTVPTKEILADHLSQMIQMKTVSNSDVNKVDWSEFEKLHKLFETLYPHVYEVMEVDRVGRAGLQFHYHPKETAKKPLLLMSHQDVVEIGDRSQWSHDPFSGLLLDDSVYGWTYWICHMPYLAQKPQSMLVALGWAIFRNGSLTKMMSPLVLQSIALILFFFFLWYASRGIRSLKHIGALAGSTKVIMSFLYILLALAAPYITEAKTFTYRLDMETLMPTFDFDYMTTLAILVFAVGGCERLSPYVNNLKDPSREYPRSMIFMTIMVCVTAILGTFAMGLMFDPQNVPKDLMMNGSYYCFAKLGEYYGVGQTFVVIFALCTLIGQASTLAVSIDAPIKILLADVDEKFVPERFRKINSRGVPVTGYQLTALLVGILIIVPALGIGDMTSLYNWLMRLNAVCMPLRYLWVFYAYMMLKKHQDRFQSDYHFVKSAALGKMAGAWCFFFTAYACFMGMFPRGVAAYSPAWTFQFTLNILTPLVLFGIGVILPYLAKKERERRAQ